jgi:hypothetical protein
MSSDALTQRFGRSPDLSEVLDELALLGDVTFSRLIGVSRRQPPAVECQLTLRGEQGMVRQVTQFGSCARQAAERCLVGALLEQEMSRRRSDALMAAVLAEHRP